MGLSHCGVGDGVGQGEGVDSADNRGLGTVDGVDKWVVDSGVVDSWESMVNIWGGQTSVDKGWVSFGLSLGNGGGNWEGVVQGVGQGESVVHIWGVDNTVDNWGVDSGVVDDWGVSNSLDNWGVDSSIVDDRGVSNSLDSSLDNWDIVDAGDGDLGLTRLLNRGEPAT